MLCDDPLASDKPLKVRGWRGNGACSSGLEALRRLASPGGEGYDEERRQQQVVALETRPPGSPEALFFERSVMPANGPA